MSKKEQATRLYQAVERLALQAGEDADETIDWLCGEHGGMAKLFEKFFSPAKILQLPVASEAEMYDAAISWCDSNGIGLDPEQLEQLVNTLFVTICDTTPPAAQRQWTGLTEKEILECRSANHLYFYKAIEAKLRERNAPEKGQPC